MDGADIFTEERERMVREDLAGRGIVDKRVLEAMRTVPRHLFVPQKYRHQAYADSPLPIGSNQTISQPYIVALMTQLLRLQGGERVLEVGTGSGYQAAVLALLAGEVHTVERHSRLAEIARQRLGRLSYENAHVHIGDGSRGWPPAAPYDGILVTAAAPRVPAMLLEQLATGGRLVIPVGGPKGQVLERWTRFEDHFQDEAIAPVAFVPLLGEFGWKE